MADNLVENEEEDPNQPQGGNGSAANTALAAAVGGNTEAVAMGALGGGGAMAALTMAAASPPNNGSPGFLQKAYTGTVNTVRNAGVAALKEANSVADAILPAGFLTGLRNAISFGGTYSQRAHGLNEYHGKCAKFGISYICDALQHAGYAASARHLNNSRQETAEDYLKSSTLQDVGFKPLDNWSPEQAVAGDVAVFVGHKDERGKYHPGHFCVCEGRDAGGKPVWVSDCVQADFGANDFYRGLVAENKGYQIFRLNPQAAAEKNAQFENGVSVAQNAGHHHHSSFGRG